tara:strand:+ start:216 stop:494 length:279 start_codon:yes stop_codon:yes gene_type:complete
MASGQFAEPIYDLLNELGGPEAASNLVLQELIKYLSGHLIEEFVEDFRCNHDMNENIVQTHFDPGIEAPTEDMETQPPVGSSSFFSSKIPEC